MVIPVIGGLLINAAIEAAPSIARWLGGESAESVTRDVAGIAKALTGQDSEGAQVAALRADPALWSQFQTAVMAHDATMEQAYLADRQHARNRDVEFIKRGDVNWRANIMLALAFVAVIAIAAIMGAGQVEAGGAVAGFLMTVGGMFARNIGSAFDFEFGSSRGSKEKDKIFAGLGVKQ